MKVEIKDMKRGDMVYDEEDRYCAYGDAYLEDGVWKVETTTGGDYIYWLVEGKHDVWDNIECQ